MSHIWMKRNSGGAAPNCANHRRELVLVPRGGAGAGRMGGAGPRPIMASGALPQGLVGQNGILQVGWAGSGGDLVLVALGGGAPGEPKKWGLSPFELKKLLNRAPTCVLRRVTEACGEVTTVSSAALFSPFSVRPELGSPDGPVPKHCSGVLLHCSSESAKSSAPAGVHTGAVQTAT